jgi:esterase/lipase superfamily enzyme
MLNKFVYPIRIFVIRLICVAAIALPAVSEGQVPGLIQPQQQFEAARASGDLTAAIAFGRQALEFAEQQFGESSIDVVPTLEMLGEVSAMAEDYDGATDYYQRVLKIKEQALGEDHPDLVVTLDALVDVSIQRAAYDEAEELLKRILKIEQATFGESHENVLISWRRLQDVYLRANRPADAAIVNATIEGLQIRTRSLDARRYTTEDGFATVRVFYGTDRAPTGKAKASNFYGNKRGELEVGYLDVSIPETHKYGELETSSRWSVFAHTMGDDELKRKYILLLNVAALEQESFNEELQQHVESSPSNDILLFVHGYNSSFEDAARRAAQLAYDLDFDGTPMMYSWPSQASTMSYTVDEAVVRLSGRRMARFLREIVEEAGADRIHLIAHSMGNRALVEALERLAAEQQGEASEPMFGQIVFTAPDVDRDFFVEAVQGLQGSAERITLYASENDLALHSSAVLHGAPRAGLAGKGIVSAAGIDTIDMSDIDADLLGHGYFAAKEGAIYDLFRLFWLGDPPQSRCGMQSNDETWSFDAEPCRGGAVLEAGLLLKRFGPDARARVQERLDSLVEADEKADKEARKEWTRILDRLDELLEADDE